MYSVAWFWLLLLLILFLADFHTMFECTSH